MELAPAPAARPPKRKGVVAAATFSSSSSVARRVHIHKKGAKHGTPNKGAHTDRATRVPRMPLDGKNVLGSRFGAPSLLVVLFTYYCGVSASSSLFLSKVLIALPKLIFPGPPATRTKSPTNSPTPFGLSFISLTEEASI